MLSWFGKCDAAGDEVAPGALRAELGSGKKILLLDVRQPEEHAAGCLPDSVLIPLDELAGRLGELDPERDTVVYCRSGARSAMACQWLRRAGFRRAWSRV